MVGNLYVVCGDAERKDIMKNIEAAIQSTGIYGLLENPENTVHMDWDDLKPFLTKMGYLENGRLIREPKYESKAGWRSSESSLGS